MQQWPISTFRRGECDVNVSHYDMYANILSQYDGRGMARVSNCPSRTG